jgi:hypothetical protein
MQRSVLDLFGNGLDLHLALKARRARRRYIH